MLAVCTSSTELALVTTQQLRDMLGTTSTANDALMQAMCNRATAEIENYLGYPLRRTVYQETVPSYDGVYLHVSRVPVLSVQSVLFSTDTIASTSYTVENGEAGLLYRKDGWTGTAPIQYGLLTARVMTGSESPDYTVVYEAGYCVNGSTGSGWLTTGEPVPYAIEDAILSAAMYRYKSKSRDLSVSSKRIGDLSITYADTPTGGLPSSVTNLVQHLRRF